VSLDSLLVGREKWVCSTVKISRLQSRSKNQPKENVIKANAASAKSYAELR
jgi:hypothetical protein